MSSGIYNHRNTKTPIYTEERNLKVGSSQRKAKLGSKNPMYGKTHSEEVRKRLSVTHSKEKHWNWKGGISHNPYPKVFNSKLKLKIRTKYNFICCRCGKTEREELEEFNRVLCVNHIDFNKNNCKEDNLNVLCLKCNVQICRDRDYWTNYFNLNQNEPTHI